MKKNLLIITWSIMMQHSVVAQSKSGIENYHFLSSEQTYVWMPVIHQQGKKGFYTELRYNYEALETASFYAGKIFNKEDTWSYSVTPMLGLVFGKLNAASVAVNLEVSYKKTFISMQSQYTVSSHSGRDNFFFNWMELGYEPFKWFYAGISTQLTKMQQAGVEAEFGLLVGFKVKKFTVPLYVFNPLSKNKNFIIGLNTEW